MKTTGWTVTAANGNTQTFASKAQAERVAKNLRTGKIAGRKVGAPMAATVTEAK